MRIQDKRCGCGVIFTPVSLKSLERTCIACNSKQREALNRERLVQATTSQPQPACKRAGMCMYKTNKHQLLTSDALTGTQLLQLACKDCENVDVLVQRRSATGHLGVVGGFHHKTSELNTITTYVNEKFGNGMFRICLRDATTNRLLISFDVLCSDISTNKATMLLAASTNS